jgi:threonine synthase
VDDFNVAGSGNTELVLDTIRSVHKDTGYLMDPHTAAGVSVARQHPCSDAPTICVSTAHPAKFSDAIRDATGENLAHHELIDGLADLPTRCVDLDASAKEVRDFLVGAL